MKRTAALILFLAGLACLGPIAAAAPADDKTPLTLRQMIGIRSIREVTLSPDGSTAAFTVMSTDWDANALTQDIWIARTDGSRCFPLTHGPAMNMSPAWTPDGSGLAFLSTREGPPQVYLYRPGYGEPEALFKAENGVQRYAWAPDGRAVAFLTSEKPDPEHVERKRAGYDAEEVDASPPRSQLHLFELATRTVKPLVAGDFHIMGFSWAPGGDRIALVTTPKAIEYVSWTDQSVRVVDRASGRLETLDFDYYGFLSRHGTPIWSPDGRYLALEVGDKAKPELHNPIIQGYDFQTGRTLDFSGPNDQFMQNCVWSRDGRSIYYVAYRLQNRPLFRLDPWTHRLEQLSHHDAVDISGFAVAADGRTMVYAASHPSWPDELYAGTIDAPDRARRITDLHPDLAGTLICPAAEIEWAGEGGLTIQGSIVYPAGYEKGRAYPTITLIHGGPAGNFNNSFNANYYCPAQFYAGQGFLVYLPNVRGSIGWGSEFMRANIRDWGGADYRDLMAGLDQLIREGLADPDRLVVWGGSYGGYMTNWIVTQTDRFKAAHSEVSISDLTSMWALSPIGGVLSRLYFEKTPSEDPDLYRRLSPFTHAARVRTPLLLTQNEKDQRVGPSPGQALEFYRAVELTGTPVRMFVYPGEGHATAKPIHQLDKLQKGHDWFLKWLGLDRPAGEGRRP